MPDGARSAENDVRTAIDLIRCKSDVDPFRTAVADWLEEAADHLAAQADAASYPPGSVCPTALEGLACSMLGHAVTVAGTYYR